MLAPLRVSLHLYLQGLTIDTIEDISCLFLILSATHSGNSLEEAPTPPVMALALATGPLEDGSRSHTTRHQDTAEAGKEPPAHPSPRRA